MIFLLIDHALINVNKYNLILLSHQKWIGLSYVAIHAYLNASERVGWAWHVRAKSSLEAPYYIPITASAIISPAPGDIIWTPRILSVFLSDKTLTKPSVSLFAFALEFAKNGKLPFLY